jgi:hypothetical protein
MKRDDGSYGMYHYYYTGTNQEIPPAALKREVEELAKNARKNMARQVPPPSGEAWDYIVWNRISYIVFMIDDPDIVFDADQPMTFGMGPSNSDYSFVDFGTFTVKSVDGARDVSVAHCVNLMKSANRQKLGKASERFGIQLNTSAPVTITRDGGSRPDDGGNNVGPPVPPP